MSIRLGSFSQFKQVTWTKIDQVHSASVFDGNSIYAMLA
jgi:hypothetical protein